VQPTVPPLARACIARWLHGLHARIEPNSAGVFQSLLWPRLRRFRVSGARGRRLRPFGTSIRIGRDGPKRFTGPHRHARRARRCHRRASARRPARASPRVVCFVPAPRLAGARAGSVPSLLPVRPLRGECALMACQCGARVEIQKVGKCRRCYSRDRKAAARRAAGRAERAPRSGRQSPGAWMNRYEPSGQGQASPVAWSTMLSEIRACLPPGSAVGIGQGGVVIDRVGLDRITFASIDHALEYLTRP
jgi:hypothetical protein